MRSLIVSFAVTALLSGAIAVRAVSAAEDAAKEPSKTLDERVTISRSRWERSRISN